jgi:hypothetical protein
VNINVPDTEDREALPFQLGRSSPICFTPFFRVLAAVDFDDQPGLNTQKIDNVSAPRDLASELESHQAAIPQARPELSFRFGRAEAR